MSATAVPPPLWKAEARVPRARAGESMTLLELTPAPSPVAVLSAEVPGEAHVTVEALYAEPPEPHALSRILGVSVTVAPLPDQDWIKRSYEGLPPVRAGRFFVHGAHDAGRVPDGVLAIRIEAGLAFGTGHHETTALCLEAIDAHLRRARPARVLDLGCGTGVLAIAVARAARVRVLATDIDPQAIEVTRRNGALNAAAPLIHAAVAEGLASRAIAAAAPFDLLIANILAGPLTRLAPGIAGVLAPGGTLILSGLMRDQEGTVLGFYRALGLRLVRVLRRNAWSALVLSRPAGR